MVVVSRLNGYYDLIGQNLSCGKFGRKSQYGILYEIGPSCVITQLSASEGQNIFLKVFS